MSDWKSKFRPGSFEKLEALGNQHVLALAQKYVELCDPATVFVGDDSREDAEYVRLQALKNGEETALGTAGHTIHFDNYKDQARDTKNTRIIVGENEHLSEAQRPIGREEALKELDGIYKGIMKGREMLIMFYCLGPVNSPFSIPCMQISDSAYVVHSEGLLYRSGYAQFKLIGNSDSFFRFVHSEGPLNEKKASCDLENRRVYVDKERNTVYSVNTQYAGNTVGLKKLAFRLALNKSRKEGWLAEHMFLMGMHGPNGRTTYFTGAFPSACGKTSTAMLPGEKIVGDDLAYIRNIDGEPMTVNVEAGIFGIIENVSEKSDPEIWKALTEPGEVIFSNVLVGADNKPYWLGMNAPTPEAGVNHSGAWQKGKTDEEGKEIPLASKNARYTVNLSRLANCDPVLNQPQGVPVSGFVYGGRDSDTSVPIAEALSYSQGVLMMGASIESETTAATLGQQGVRKFNVMSLIEFLPYPMGEYLQNVLNFQKGLKRVPKIFGVNYFLKGQDGQYISGIRDKHVWLKWAELRVHGEAEGIPTPVGTIPKYEDLRRLFQEVLKKDYSRELYEEQFTIRVPKLLEKIARIRKIYQDAQEATGTIPAEMFAELDAQERRLNDLRSAKGDLVAPSQL